MTRRAAAVSVLALSFVIGLVYPSMANAQTSTTNKAFVRSLFLLEHIDPEPAELVDQLSGQFADAITRFIGVALSTTPSPSSSAGFSFVTTKGGLEKPKSESFGPVFADRPLTNGKGVVSFGVNFYFAQTNFDGDFDTADGRTKGLPLLDNPRTYTDGFVEYNTFRAFLEAQSVSFDFMLSYGVSDRIDIGVVVPVVSLSLTGRTDQAYDETKQSAAGLNPPGFAPVGVVPQKSSTSHSATGLGDVAVRAKYSWAGERSEGVAVVADLRLPTGDEEELLGAGKAALKLQAVLLKGGLGGASIHANGGFTAGGLTDEINFVAGADRPMLSKKQMTVSASFLGRTLLSGARPSRYRTVQPTTVPATPQLMQSSYYFDRFEWVEQHVTLLQVAAGMKVQVSSNWLLAASVLIPVNERGLQPRISPVIGLERTWR